MYLHDRSEFTEKLIEALGIPSGTTKVVITIEVSKVVEIELWSIANADGEFPEGKKYRLVEIGDGES